VDGSNFSIVIIFFEETKRNILKKQTIPQAQGVPKEAEKC